MTTTHKSIYMIERADGSGDYRRGSRADAHAGARRGTIHLEGVDGDEETNVVTYWYSRSEERP